MLLNKFNQTIRDFVAPNYCLVTDEPLDQDRFLSQKAIDKIDLAPDTWEISSKKLPDLDESYLTQIFALMSASENEDFMDLIYRIKYQGIYRLAVELGEFLGKKIKMEINSKVDAIVPVPIHKVKLRERGFNQSFYIAQGISNILNIPIREDLCERTVYTTTQTKLSDEKRKRNLEGVFKSKFDDTLENILICDDVFTTGSTMNEAAKSLKNAGFNNILGASIIVA